jgi:hypothetical protein
MATRAKFRHEDVAEVPRGWKVRTIAPSGAKAHEIRVAFPPGRRKKGSGKLISILHPKKENPASCSMDAAIRENPNLWIHKAIERPGRLRLALHKREGEKITAGELNDVIAHPHKYDRSDPVGIERAALMAKRLAKYKHNPKKKGPARRKKSRKGKNPGELLIFGNPKKKGAYVIRWSDGGYSQTFRHKQAAQGYLRRSKRPGQVIYAEPGHDFRNPRRKKHRRNPGDLEAGVNLYDTFHGKSPDAVRTITEPAAIPSDFVSLGKAICLVIAPDRGKAVRIGFSDSNVTLAANASGTQLYFVGGDQSLDSCHGSFPDADWSKDDIDLGDALRVEYAARKRMDDFRAVTYYHDLGEDSGTLPRARYDRLNKRIHLSGGNYRIEAPGIID